MGKLKKKEVVKYKDDMVDLYKSGKNTYEIADKYCTHAGTIRQILIGIGGIKLRSLAETNHMRFANHTKLSNQALDMITGWLLGDGGIWYTGKQAYFCLTSKHKEYVDYANNIMKEEGLNCRINKVVDKKYNSIAYKMFTPSTIQFAELYNKWYFNGKKIVPKNLKLTKTAVKNWIMDDGTRDKKKGHLRLCTCSFTVNECEYLSSKLNLLLDEDNASWVVEKKKYPRIYMPRVYADKLFNILGKCDVICFSYKWESKKVNNIRGLHA